MKKSKGIVKYRWLGKPTTLAEVELRQALDQGAKRAADEVALRRVWGRLSEIPNLVPSPESERDHNDESLDKSVDKSLNDRRARRGPWAWAVAASLAGATATLAFMLVQTRSQTGLERATVRTDRTEATPSAPAIGKAATTVDQGSTLVAPATVRTGFGETLHLALRGGSKVTVTSESTLVLNEDDRPAVSAGEVQFDVPHQPAGQTFSVTAGNYRVRVVGTRFRVRVAQADVAVGVDEGVVEIWTAHRVALVRAGESWVGHPGAAAPLPHEGDTITGQSGLRGKGKSAVESTTPPRSARASALTTPGTSPSAWDSRARAVAAADDRRELLALSSPGSAAAVPAKDAVAPRTTVAAPAVAAPAPITPPPATVVPADGASVAIQARAARAAGDTRRALGLYRSLAEKGGAAGENAEYEIARLLRDGLHQPREAVFAWRLYRAQHPRGLLRIETDISVIETLVAMGDKTAAVAEATDFMRRYPDSERRAEIARLAGDLLRERGACAEAVAAYDVALGSGHGRREVSDSPSFHRAVCLLRADRGAGLAALQAYLLAFPAGGFRGQAQRLLNGADGNQQSSSVR